MKLVHTFSSTKLAGFGVDFSCDVNGQLKNPTPEKVAHFDRVFSGATSTVATRQVDLPGDLYFYDGIRSVSF